MSAVAPGKYVVDPVRSTITFTTKHMFGLGKVVGTFAVKAGQVTVAAPGAASRVEAVVDAASVKTDQQRRDVHVRSKTFLHTDEHPTLDFVSDSVQPADDGWLVDGVLTVRGRQNPVSLLVDTVAESNGTLTAKATASIDRYAHGVSAMKGMAGRHLELVFEITAVTSGSTAERVADSEHRRG
jgi:polyisoprenoid-binding protein YceI